MGWAKRLGAKVLRIVYNADSVPWCGVFVAACLHEAGLPSAPIAVRATAWTTYGQRLRFERLAPGAILVFQRPGGGHVGFYVGEDADAFHVLGGNQGNAVTIMRIMKDGCIAARWPMGVAVIGGRYNWQSRGPRCRGTKRDGRAGSATARLVAGANRVAGCRVVVDVALIGGRSPGRSQVNGSCGCGI